MRTLSEERDIEAFMQSTARRQVGRRLALDVGAREGQSSKPYDRVGWLVISLDIAIEGLRVGVKEGNIRPRRAVVADGRRLPFRDAAFDLVSSRWFLHEFPDQPAFLGEMKRVVRDRGAVVAVDFAAPDHASQTFLNQYILPDEHVRTCDQFTEPWVGAGLGLERIEWHARRIQEHEAEVRDAACGADRRVSEEVRRELHITCDDEDVSLDIPIAFVVAHKEGSPEER